MTFRIGWLSPLTPASGVGTFSHSIARVLPTQVDGEPIEVTMLYPEHAVLHRGSYRAVRIEDTESFRNVLDLFDVLVYNIGNNTEHHETIFRLLRTNPGIVICHDYVYQHYLADRSMNSGGNFASFAAMLMKFGDDSAGPYLARSRITNRLGKIRYSPWDSEASAVQPMSEGIVDLGSALVVHSRFAQRRVEKRFQGPILRLGMPHDQKPPLGPDTLEAWAKTMETKHNLHAASFGHIQSTKCLDIVLEAMAASDALTRGLRYTIAGHVGDWDYLRRLQEIVAEAGMQESVRFETSVSELRLSEIMRDADFFINLRKPNTEGSSASLIEQLDSGRPVVVLDSGCYAEVPSDAALKLPAEAQAEDVRAALEQFIAAPKHLPPMGRAGRMFARAWNCASYGESLVRFALEHHDLLKRRGRMTGVGDGDRHGDLVENDEAWVENLAQARGALRYLDRNVLALDPELVMNLRKDDLCTYVAHVVFGIFDDARLDRALSRFFASRTGRVLYWDCAKFSIIAEAVLAKTNDARERLVSLGPCYDPDFWSVLVSLPALPFADAAALMLLGRPPSTEEIALAGARNQNERLAKRMVLLEVVRQSSDGDDGLAKLRRSLEQPFDHELETELPLIDGDLECMVGSALFREHADLSGFYAQEADHAWTRGARGFIGLRLGPNVMRIETSVRNINPDPDRPAVVALSSGTASVEVEIRSDAPQLLSLDICGPLKGADATTWLQLSTTRHEPPQRTLDTRVLGVCLLALKVVVGSMDKALALARQPNP